MPRQHGDVTQLPNQIQRAVGLCHVIVQYLTHNLWSTHFTRQQVACHERIATNQHVPVS